MVSTKNDAYGRKHLNVSYLFFKLKKKLEETREGENAKLDGRMVSIRHICREPVTINI